MQAHNMGIKISSLVIINQKPKGTTTQLVTRSWAHETPYRAATLTIEVLEVIGKRKHFHIKY